MRGVRGVNRPIFACRDKLTLELNPANNTLMFLFYKCMHREVLLLLIFFTSDLRVLLSLH